MSLSPPVAVLIATRDREALLTARSLPSVLAQSHQPDVVTIVNDGRPFTSELRRELTSSSSNAEVVLLCNRRAPGVAGAWNTGLAHLWGQGHRGFIAILDDDDEWDHEHLQANATAVTQPGINVVVSGLRMAVAGAEQPRPLIQTLTERDFLIGNPGWQGSNTFVTLPLLAAVGGFREGLQSLNDRDLALRLLRNPQTRWALVERWTATWHRDTPSSLSLPDSPAKLSGLRWFWQIYASEMTVREEEEFFSRAERLFAIPRHRIVEGTIDRSPNHRALGDLDVDADQ